MTADEGETTPPCCAPRRAVGGPAPLRSPGSPAGAGSGLARAELVRLAGGEFEMGSDAPEAYPEDREGPQRRVTVEPFEFAATAVTNREFAEFVDHTDHRTDAEIAGWSFVFHLLLHPQAAPAVMDAWVPATPWWLAVRGATWSAPDGPGSDLAGRWDHPVVHVSVRDAEAYCRWSDTRLPREIEWEYAARGGITGAMFPWGDELDPGGLHLCNVWRGDFPRSHESGDEFRGPAPVAAYPPNGFGLYNMVGNVWEISADPWDGGSDPSGERSLRGGSYLCHASYCTRYRVSARTRTTLDSSTGNTGFRVAR